MINDDSSGNSRLDYIRIANYYYKAGLTQEEIARNMNMSRQKVNRMLSKCIELGVVQISVEGVEDTHIELESLLEKKYGLKAVRVSGKVSEENAYEIVGKIAAEYLGKTITKDDVIGFSRGRSMSSLVAHMPIIKTSNLMVTQLMGGWNNQQTNENVDDIVHRFSEKTNARSTVLYAPIVVNNPELRSAIVKEPFFYEAYKVIKSCTIAVVGIGDAKKDKVLPTMEQLDYEKYIKKNAVGEICTHFFDIDGNAVITEFDERVIAVKLDDFFAIPLRIAVAGLQSKIPGILGALKGGYINALITDFDTAQILAQMKI